MATSQMSEVIRHLRKTVLLRNVAGLTDGQLLEDFISRRDEAALEALVQRHGPMVWGVCCRVLSNHHDAEDAFQVTFLVLVRKAASIASRELLPNWLYGVAYQTALKARATAAKRRGRERQVTEMPEPESTPNDIWHDLQPLLDQELSRLPDRYRIPIVLCDLEGKTRKEAAQQLGWPEGTVAGRLARAREMLAKRLIQHGLVLSGGSLAVALSQNVASAGVPVSVATTTIKTAALVAAGHTAATAKVAALTEGVLKAMLLTRLKMGAVMVLLAMSVVGLGGVFSYCVMAGDRLPIEQTSNQPKPDKTEEPGQRAVAKKKDSQLIQGTWLVTKIEVDGRMQDAEKEERWSVSKDTIKWSGRIRSVELNYSLNPTETPKAIDMKISAGQGTGGKFNGIYALDGETLKVCYQIGSEERPEVFQTKQGDSTKVLLTLKRMKQDADDGDAPKKSQGNGKADKKDPPKNFTNSMGMKFVWIRPGNFTMGSPKEEKQRQPGETQHKVTLTKGFYMGAHTVTQEQWQEIMGNNPSKFKDEKNLPVETVSWDDCQEFIKKLREKDKKPYRLSTEAEWEYSCRAGATTPFHFGETISTEQSNYNGDYFFGKGKKGVNRQKTSPVGSFPANAWGLHDMHGNVYQWCQDWYGDYPQKDVVDPQGGDTGKFRVLRGGSWVSFPDYCRSASRGGDDPGLRKLNFGCRICFSLE